MSAAAAQGEDIRETEGEPTPKTTEQFLREKVEALERQITRLNQSLFWAARVLGPLILGAAYLALLVALYPPEVFAAVLAYPWPHINKVAVVTLLAAGRGEYTVLEATIIFGITDALVALWFVLNFPLLYKIPRLGRSLERAEHRMRRELKRHKGLGVFNVLGTFLWVVLPFPGTGTITGAILGRFLGLGTWLNYVTVTAGAVLAVYGYAAGAGAVVSAFERSSAQGWAAIVVLVGLVGIVFIAYRAWWAPRRRRRQQRGRTPAASEDRSP